MIATELPDNAEVVAPMAAFGLGMMQGAQHHFVPWDFVGFRMLPEILHGTPITVVPGIEQWSLANKRYVTACLAMHMPDEGVAENFESAVECWNFYAERPPELTKPPAAAPVRKAKVTGSSTRPGLIITE